MVLPGFCQIIVRKYNTAETKGRRQTEGNARTMGKIEQRIEFIVGSTKKKKNESRASEREKENIPVVTPSFPFSHYFANLFLGIMRIDAVYQ